MRKLNVIFMSVVLLMSVLVSGKDGYASSKGEEVVSIGKQYMGVPYSWGGTTPSGFDCSGFLLYVFNQVGISLPRTAASQFDEGQAIDKDQLQVGDLVFYTTYKPGPSHAGIYVGDGQFIHSSSSHGVTISDVDGYYWNERYLGARRYISENEVVVSQSLPTNEEVKVYWDGLLMKKGQIGKIKVVKPINLWKRTDNGLEFERILYPGEQYRVYRYDNLYGGQYGLGGGYYITNMDGYVDYRTPSKSKLALLN